MSDYVLSRRAHVDLQLIWNHLAEQSFDAADKVAEDLRLAMAKLAVNPQLGHQRDGPTVILEQISNSLCFLMKMKPSYVFILPPPNLHLVSSTPITSYASGGR